MDPKLRSLVWMELRERRMPLIFGLVWMLGGTTYWIAAAMVGRFQDTAVGFFATGLWYAISMPIFLAMRTSLGEITDRTRSFSAGLPVSGRWRGWIRLGGGAGVLILPFVLAAIVLLVSLALGWLEPANFFEYGHRPDRGDRGVLSAVRTVWHITATGAISAIWLYLVLALWGTKLRAESHLGYCGAGAACFCWVLSLILKRHFESSGELEIAAWVGATAVIQFALAAIFVRRYSGRFPGSPSKPVENIARCVWWRPRLPTPGMALAWLAWRQSVPMCLPGLAIICIVVAVLASFESAKGAILQGYVASLPGIMSRVGMLWAVVVGAGIFSAEIDWRNGEFWRTRPISTSRLFSIKFVAGLLAVWLVLDGTAMATTWFSPGWGDKAAPLNWVYAACILPLHATMFAIAVAWTCLLRQAVLGGMAAIATFTITNVSLEWSSATQGYDPVHLYYNLQQIARNTCNPVDFSAEPYPVVVAAMGVILVASILIGWRALRRYDPRRQTG